MNQQSEHLNDAQIEQYGNQSSGAGVSEEIDNHLADCSSCQSRVLSFQRAHFELMADPSVNYAPTPDCPGDDDLRQLVAGVSPQATAVKLTQHAAQCDYCGPLLSGYIEDFSEDLNSDDRAVLKKLRSVSPVWQQETARRILAITSKDSSPSATVKAPKSLLWRRLVLLTAATICVAVALGVWNSQRETPERVETLLAQAYTEQRTMDIRFPGARWGPVAVSRGSEDSTRPFTLLGAKRIITRQRQKAPVDFRWIDAQAQAEILNGDAPAAIARLTQATVLHPDSVSMLLDLSIAHFQQGDRSQARQEYEESLTCIAKVLQHDSTNRVALFNRALVYQRLHMEDRAKESWKAFLESQENEQDERWLEEGRKRLADLQVSK